MGEPYSITEGGPERFFKTDEDVRATLREEARSPWQIQDHIRFAGDDAVAQILGQERSPDNPPTPAPVTTNTTAARYRLPGALRSRGVSRLPDAAEADPQSTVYNPSAALPPGQPSVLQGGIHTGRASSFIAPDAAPGRAAAGMADTAGTAGTAGNPAAGMAAWDDGHAENASQSKPAQGEAATGKNSARRRADRRTGNRVAAEQREDCQSPLLSGDADAAGNRERSGGRGGKRRNRKSANAPDESGTAPAPQAGKPFFREETPLNASQLGKKVVLLAGEQIVSHNLATPDFSSSTPIKFKDAAVAAHHGIATIKHLIRNPKKLLIGGGVFLAIGLLAMVSSSQNTAAILVTNTLCADRSEDIQRLVSSINNYRDNALTDEIYHAFQSERDPNGNAYGYRTLTGKKSNNLTHGVTWRYANGISNDTAEILSLAAVYFQQNWPASAQIADFDQSDSLFCRFCKDLAAYGLDVTAQESHPYACMPYGGCVRGWRSEGETVEITDYREVLHVCSLGDSDCGQYVGSGETERWEWKDGHGEGQQRIEWEASGSHPVTVFFPVTFPDGAEASALSVLPDDAVPIGSSIPAQSASGSLVLTDSNLYKGIENDWFYQPGQLTGSFSVVTGEGETAVTDTYEVPFQNAVELPWCPGLLNDSQHGHYDLNVTLYLTGYDTYADPETTAPDGAAGGSGNLAALAQKLDGGTLTRTVSKKDQNGTTYAAAGAAARYTKSVALPTGASGFSHWYSGGQDTDGNVAWAETLYKMDWEALYGVTDGIKCRTVGRGLSSAELEEIMASLGLDGDTAAAQVVAVALASQGQFSYLLGAKPSGGPGNVTVGASLDCSGFIRYCYWSAGLPFDALNTADYAAAGDLAAIDSSELLPGDLRVVRAAGGVQGHVQMYIGSGSWAECCSGYGVSINMSNAWMESRPCTYYRYAGF